MRNSSIYIVRRRAHRGFTGASTPSE
jgi:hypothetical protein